MGSANLSTRSMRLDTECAAAIEVDRTDSADVAGFRNSLLAEHLGTDEVRVAAAVAHDGLAAAVDRLRGGARTLIELEVGADEIAAPCLPEVLADPQCPIDEALARYALPVDAAPTASPRAGQYSAAARRRRRVVDTACAVGAAASARSSRRTAARRRPRRPTRNPPLRRGRAFRRAGCRAHRRHRAGPRYLPGNRRRAGRLAAERVPRLWHRAPAVARRTAPAGRSQAEPADAHARRPRLHRRAGGPALPLAPFTVVNVVAGGSQISFGDFLLGTLAGMAPGIVVLAWTANGVVARPGVPPSARSPSQARS